MHVKFDREKPDALIFDLNAHPKNRKIKKDREPKVLCPFRRWWR